MTTTIVATKRLPALLALFALLVVAQAVAQSLILNNSGKKKSVAIRNATIVPVSSAPISGGTIVLADGRIAAVAKDVAIPAGTEIVDGTGLFVYPGLIEAGADIGLTEISSVAGTNDTTELGDINPNARVAVALNPHSNVIPVTRVNGITTALTEPRGGMISGQSAVIDLYGWTPAEMTVKSPFALHINFPSMQREGRREGAHDEDAEKEAKKAYAKQLDRLRETFRDAQAYARASAARTAASTTPRFDRDLVLEAMVPYVTGIAPIVIHANYERDIREAIKFADEFKIKMILSGADDASRVVDDLKKRNIPVLLGPILALPLREDDPYDAIFANGQALAKAGIPFAIRTNDAHNARNLPYHAAACAAFGLSKEDALKSVTLWPAQILGIADKAGSLEVGKVANVIVTNGDPLEIVTNVQRLYIRGEEIPIDSLHIRLWEKFKQRP